jgi:hypothetical protein
MFVACAGIGVALAAFAAGVAPAPPPPSFDKHHKNHLHLDGAGCSVEGT